MSCIKLQGIYSVLILLYTLILLKPNGEINHTIHDFESVKSVVYIYKMFPFYKYRSFVDVLSLPRPDT
jgi:hypothetical protein